MALSSDMGGPYGVSKGIWSGTKSRGFVSAGCGARVALAALPVFSSDIRPPSTTIACLAATWIDGKNKMMHFLRDRSGRATDCSIDESHIPRLAPTRKL